MCITQNRGKMGKDGENSNGSGNSGSGGATKLAIFQTTQMSEFSPDSQRFDEWRERLEIYFIEVNITDEPAKRASLLRTIGVEPYSLLRALSDPKKPTEKTYTELCKLLETHYMPPVIIYRERLNFYTATKGEEETVSQWYARVKSLALKCKFTALDDYVRDRFIMGMVSNEKFFEKMCEEDDKLDLATALRKALLQETKLKGKSMSSDVNFVRGGQRIAPQLSDGSNHRKSGSNNNKNNEQTRTPCKHCGWKSHQSNSCKYKEVICRTCGKKGHMASICRNKKNKSTNFIDLHTPQNDKECISNTFLNFSNTDIRAGDACARSMESNGIFSISENKKCGMASRSFKLTVDINGIRFDEVKCDTGAPCSLMSIGTFDRFFDRNLLKFRAKRVYRLWWSSTFVCRGI